MCMMVVTVLMVCEWCCCRACSLVLARSRSLWSSISGAKFSASEVISPANKCNSFDYD